MNLVDLLVWILVLGLVFGLVYWVIGQMPLPAPFKTGALAVLGLIIVILLLGALFGGISMPRLLH